MAEYDIVRARKKLMDDIERDAHDTMFWTRRERFSDAVMAAMARVPRHAFVPEDERPFAYVNRPRPIGHGQTISQPYIVALMSDLLDLGPDDKVLEIGAGSGYQSAVLAELAGRVFSLERIASLAEGARTALGQHGYDTVSVVTANGYEGLPDEAPFDAIMVTAAPDHVPDALVAQLKAGGRMIIPIGKPHTTQMLRYVKKNADGTITTRDVLPVAFVPMVA